MKKSICTYITCITALGASASVTLILLFAGIAAACSGGGEGGCSTAPSVTTKAAGGVTPNSATLNGSVSPNGCETTAYFLFRKSGGTWEKGSTKAVSSIAINEAVSEPRFFLQSQTTYEFRLVAFNSFTSKEGAIESFTTEPEPSGEGKATWTIQSTPSPAGATSTRLKSASCTSSTACTSVGSFVNSSGSRVPLAERWNGTAWTAQSPPGTGIGASELLAVSCPSSSFCAAVGTDLLVGEPYPLPEIWNGSSWTVEMPSAPSGATETEMNGVSCTSSTACTAVGRYKTSSGTFPLAMRWNGGSWAIQTVPTPTGGTNPALRAVSCTSSTACIATGSYVNSSGVQVTLAESWNGTSWSIQSIPIRTGATQSTLLGISCSSSTACTAVGSDVPSGGGSQETLVERWNGTSWAIQASPNPSSSQGSVLRGVSCISASSCTAAGNYVSAGTHVTLTERWNGSAWSLLVTPNPSGATFSELWSVACWSAAECVAPGYYKNSAGTELALTEKSS
jgi:hypothetical protein